MLPNVTAFELSLALLDPNLLRPGNRAAVQEQPEVGLPAYVRYLDPEINTHWFSLIELKRVMRSAVAFMESADSAEVGKC